MKVDNDFIIHNFHAERYWNDIGILFSQHCNSYSITSIQDSQNFFIIPNFSIFSSHHGNLHNFYLLFLYFCPRCRIVFFSNSFN